jgi:hypothetical protein
VADTTPLPIGPGDTFTDGIGVAVCRWPRGFDASGTPAQNSLGPVVDRDAVARHG